MGWNIFYTQFAVAGIIFFRQLYRAGFFYFLQANYRGNLKLMILRQRMDWSCLLVVYLGTVCIEIYVYFSQIDTYFGLPTQLISNIWFCCSDSQITLDYAAQFLIEYRLRGDNEINESLRSTWRDRQWYGYINQRILLNIVKNSSKLLW